MSKTNRRDFLISAAPAAATLLVPTLSKQLMASPPADLTQGGWRYCDKCLVLFYSGYASHGRCQAGGAHEAQGYEFLLPYTGNLAENVSTPKVQANWRYCDKCLAMFWNGVSDKGRCPSGGGHEAQGNLFRLPHDINVDSKNQGGWRFCQKCKVMFYDGYSGKGKCPGGDGHVAQGYLFVLPHGPAPFAAIDLSQIAVIVPSEAHFHQVITTPSGTALGGYVDLTLRSDGTLTAQFYMSDSGKDDYSFTVRAVFTTSNGMVFAIQQSGHVQGHIFGDKGRRFNQTVVDSHPFIKENWAAVKAGHMAVSKQYKDEGLVGFVQDVANVVLDVTKSAASAASSAVIALGDEMKREFKNLELGGTLGIIAGVVVFAAGGSLVLAVTTGVQVGLMTTELVQKQPLNMFEMILAKEVFGETSLPSATQIYLTNLESLGGRAFTIPGVGGKIYLNVGADCFNHPMTHVGKNYPSPGQLFIHEMTHAWQIHHSSFVPGYICSGLTGNTGKITGDSAYKYGPPWAPNTKWSDYHIEQQASIVDQWFGAQRVTPQKRMDQTDDYFHYIRDNIRAGRT